MATGALIFPVGYAPLDNGAVVSGGRLTFSRTGTTTLQNTYSDSALTVPNTNPVILNSEGSIDTKIYGDPFTGFDYRVVLTTSTDVTIWTVDDVVVASPGTINDAQLSANVPLKNASNTFTESQYITKSSTGAVEVGVQNGNAGTAAYAWYYAHNGTNYGGMRYTGVNFSSGVLANGPSGEQFAIYTSTTKPLVFGVGIAASFWLGTDGLLNSPNASAQEVGYKGTPINDQDGNYTLVLTDAGKMIYKGAGGAGETITIPANASVSFPRGTRIRVINNGGGTLTVAITSDTLSLAGAGTTGSRTLSDHGTAWLEKVATTEWFISGDGIT